MPALGRMNLSKSLNPLGGFEKIMGWIRAAPLVYLPLFAYPAAAMAAFQQPPPGFEDFSPIHESMFADFLFQIQQVVDINKDCILFVEQILSKTCGVNAGSAGLSIMIWAMCLKLLAAPFYEGQMKYPAQMEKAV